ncbi:O-antigen ligase family protein [Candidatus Oleimmundimicrobium sp.]|uniref:O-antigen ligase family protein n=1 Tax=Candidatus Oleimmundimicrobium sp. TaxID=3060597 RepID=UPI002719D6CE|nr:O-antigen ligase family protein [Candidatus Oleimmundimicrobium sp.]MDO8885926.1 O-antigen ligase family protein [Candidatus Oleimmundimicrobium sp.]
MKKTNKPINQLSGVSVSLNTYILIAVAFIVPVLVCPWTFDFYNLPKIVFLHMTTLIMLSIWFYEVVRDGYFVYHRTSMDLPLFLLALTIILSTIFSVNPLISIFGQYRRFEGLPALLNYIILFYLAFYFFREEKQIKWLATSFVAASFLASIYGIAQYFGLEFLHVASQPFGIRIFSSLGNPVFLAAFLAMSIPITIVLFSYVKDSLQRFFLATFLLTELACLFLTYSRGGWLGFLAGAVFLIVFIGKQFLQKRKVFIVPVCCFLMLILISTFFLGSFKKDTSSSQLSRIASSFALKEGTVGTRLSIWESTVRMIADRPVLGYGPELFRTVFPSYRSLTFIRIEGEKAMPDRAHNDFLQIAAGTGLLGFAFYLWVLVAFFLSAKILLKKVRGSSSYLLFVGILAACVAYIVQIQFEPSMVGVTPLFWLLMGSAMTVGNFADFRTWETGKYELPAKFRTFMVILFGSFLIVVLSLNFYFGTLIVADIHNYRGAKLGASGRINEAVGELERAVTLNPYYNIYRFYLSGAYVQKAKITNNPFWADRAILIYNEALEFDNLDEDIYFNLGNTLSYYGFKWQKDEKLLLAEAAYKKSIEIDKYFSAAHQRLGTLYRMGGLYEDAILELNKAIFTNPGDFLSYYELGLAYESKGDIENAIKAHKRALEIKPNFKEAKMKLELLLAGH